MKYKNIAYLIILSVTSCMWLTNNLNTTGVAIIQGRMEKVIENNIVQDNLTTKDESNIININTAGVKELDELHKIGPIIAQRIIDYRTQNGPFKNKEDIMNVKGIGNKTFEGIKDSISVK